MFAHMALFHLTAQGLKNFVSVASMCTDFTISRANDQVYVLEEFFCTLLLWLPRYV